MLYIWLYVTAVSLFWIYLDISSANADQPSGVERAPASNTIDRSFGLQFPFLLRYDPAIHVHALLEMPTAVRNILQGAIKGNVKDLHDHGTVCRAAKAFAYRVVELVCSILHRPGFFDRLFIYWCQRPSNHNINLLPFLKDTTRVPCCAI